VLGRDPTKLGIARMEKSFATIVTLTLAMCFRDALVPVTFTL